MLKLLNKIPFEFVFLFFILFEALLITNSDCIWLTLIPVGLCIFFAYYINRTGGILCAAGIILACIFFQIHSIPSPDSLRNSLDSRPVYGRIRFEIIDPLHCDVGDISNGATTLVNICSIQDNSGTVYRGSGNFLLFSRELLPQNAFYGDIFEIEGSLRFSTAETIWDIDNDYPVTDFRFGNFHNYMKLHNIDGMISPDKNTYLHKISSNDSFFRKLLMLRDRTLHYFVRNIQNKNDKNITAAMFFGLKGALSASDKVNFIKSGTIHLFSVSGLHIGILFAMLLPLLAFLPVQWRYFCASMLLIPFLLTTGANIPALRAFLMILTFSLLRLHFFHIPPLRILAAGCSVFLIYRPDYLFDAGFLYSFSITAILLSISAGFSRWNRINAIDFSLMAVNRKNPERLRKGNSFILKSIYALGSTCAAFAGGSIISLFTFGGLYLASVWINFFILFYSTYLIYIFILNFLLLPFSAPGIYSALLFEKSINFMQKVIEYGAQYPCRLNTPQISIAGAIIFYLSLIALLCIRNRKIFIISGAAVIMFFPLNMLLVRLQSPQLLAIREPSDGKIAFVLADPRGNYAWCFNIQDTASAETARKFITAKGLSHTNMWIISGTAANRFNALNSFTRNNTVGKIIHITRAPFKKSQLLPRNVVYENINAPLANWRKKENSATFFIQKSKTGFEYFNPRAILPLYVFFDTETNLLNITQGNKTVTKELPNSNITEYSVYEL